MISSQTLCVIRNVQRSIEMLEVNMIEQTSLTLNEVMLMFALEQNGKCCSGEIAKYADYTKSSTSKTLCMLESKKLIKRSVSTVDHRQMYFELTATGIKKIDNIKQVIEIDQDPLKIIIEGCN